MDSQIKPFVDQFIATLNEYRTNYKKTKSSLNYKRANYIRKMLNRMTDDDTGGQPLGDLLLNETKYELGDDKYNALSDKEKKNHADILTILMQANGQATLTMENLLTQAADPNKDTWADRFLGTTLSDLEDQVQEEDKSISSHKDVLKALDRKYGDTLREFFEQKYDDVSSDSGIRKLYPIVDALTDGQIAGLEFLSFPELFQIAMSDAATYENMAATMKEVDVESIYAGVDRGIYEKGGVALTSEALRAKALANQKEPAGYQPSALTISMWGVTIGFAAATVTTKVIAKVLAKSLPTMTKEAISSAKEVIADKINDLMGLKNTAFEKFKYWENLRDLWTPGTKTYNSLNAQMEAYKGQVTDYAKQISDLETKQSQVGQGAAQKAGSTIADKLAVGFAVVTVIMTVTSTVMTLLEAADFYDTEYIPIPKYMVDEADITAYNDRGEKTMIKNQTVYYKVVPCNRTAGDNKITKKNYEIMGDSNDLNGDIGRQWLALYAVKYEFGSQSAIKPATNLNNKHYLFPDNPPSIKVFFKNEKKTVAQLTGGGNPTATGSVFSGGSLAIGGGAGLLIGAVLGALVVGRRKKEGIVNS